MKLSKRLRYSVEYVFLRLGLGAIRLAPLRPAVWGAQTLASLAFALMGSKRRIAIDNILKAGITESPQDARRIAKASFRHFGAMVIESLKAETLVTESNWRDHVDINYAPGTLDVFKAPGLGVVGVTAHFGNWEVAAQCMSFFKPVVAVARRMNNPFTDDLIQNRKNQHRFRIVPKYGSFAKRMVAPIENGEILALLTDQHARKSGIMIDFLGRPAACHTSPARLHLMTEAPIVFAYCVRTGLMTYRLKSIAPIQYAPTGDRDADIRTILETLTAGLEQAIRANPEQYLWAHRRWR